MSLLADHEALYCLICRDLAGEFMVQQTKSETILSFKLPSAKTTRETHVGPVWSREVPWMTSMQNARVLSKVTSLATVP